jgi:hypothetical protein
VAVALTLALVGPVAGCGGSTPGLEEPAPSAAPRVYSAAQVFAVEVWGAQAPDTVVTFPASSGRSIVLRHGPPDNTVFAEVDIPADAFSPTASGEPVTLSIRPTPGIYGLTLESGATLTSPIVLTFKYPVHFAAPSDSRARYPTDVLFEQAVAIALVENDGAQFRTLRSTRPASDNLQATISVLGRYQLVAPR